MTSASGNNDADLEAELLELASQWCKQALSVGADYAQAYAECATEIRVQQADGAPVDILIDRRGGIALQINNAGSWRFSSAPIGSFGALADWLAATTGAPARVPGGSWSPVRFEPPQIRLTGRDLPQIPTHQSITRTCHEDVFLRTSATADSAGQLSAFSGSGRRLRVNAKVVTAEGTFHGFGRWYGSLPRLTGDVLPGLAEYAIAQAETAVAGTSLGSRRTPVALGPGVGAGLMHELIGHAVEADNLARKSDYVNGLMNSRVALEDLSIIDDPQWSEGFGSAVADDEGVLSRAVTLVDSGRVVGALQSVRTSREIGVTTTGHGRRRSYRFAALPRATNTVVKAGRTPAGALTSPGPAGLLYISALGAGDVDINRGDFSFTTAQSHYITPGGTWIPLRDTILFGDIRQTLDRFTAIGDDTGADNVMCSKQGQYLGIGLISPTLLFDDLTWRS